MMRLPAQCLGSSMNPGSPLDAAERLNSEGGGVLQATEEPLFAASENPRSDVFVLGVDWLAGFLFLSFDEIGEQCGLLLTRPAI